VRNSMDAVRTPAAASGANSYRRRAITIGRSLHSSPSAMRDPTPDAQASATSSRRWKARGLPSIHRWTARGRHRARKVRSGNHNRAGHVRMSRIGAVRRRTSAEAASNLEPDYRQARDPTSPATVGRARSRPPTQAKRARAARAGGAGRGGGNAAAACAI
jgi:hypothetical protein